MKKTLEDIKNSKLRKTLIVLCFPFMVFVMAIIVGIWILIRELQRAWYNFSFWYTYKDEWKCFVKILKRAWNGGPKDKYKFYLEKKKKL